ncbi:MAG: NAD(P)/FAD-dependent oxidoreductase [Candidatus Ornithospirochaeta sp.]|nr:NAD(P)/FAD-dependent oxidoreductase [Candidatus Ornithospirochaeta sp.]
MDIYDVVIVGTGPAGMGAAFSLLEKKKNIRILMIDKSPVSTGGMRNDCKMNFTYPIGFPFEYWDKDTADRYLEDVTKFLKPNILPKSNISTYQTRAEKLGCSLLEIKQTHLGTDGGLRLIKELLDRLDKAGVDLALREEMISINNQEKVITTDKREIGYRTILIAPGRHGFRFLQDVMHQLGVKYMDNILDVGIRVETRIDHYPIVKDYYDPKFYFPEKVRTFCTNSGNAHVVKEKYTTSRGDTWYSVNGHAYAADPSKNNGLVNFAILKTVRFTEPLASGQEFAEHLGVMATLMGGGKPLMQRVGDFRMGKRSKLSTFNNDLYDFEPSLKDCCPSDISLAMPSKILRYIWSGMKKLDTIIPGILHPSTIMYYPEIKLYANKPEYIDDHFQVQSSVFFAGDGAGTSRGITGAWASGIRASEGMAEYL